MPAQNSTNRFDSTRVVQAPGRWYEITAPVEIASDTGTGDHISLTHRVPHRHVDPCVFKDTSVILDSLTDLNFEIQLLLGSLRQAVVQFEFEVVTANLLGDDTLTLTPGFTDSIRVGSFVGYRITDAVEGCGEYRYYFPLNPGMVMFVRRSWITKLNPIVGTWKETLRLPGVIPPSEEERLFDRIVASFRLLE